MICKSLRTMRDCLQSLAEVHHVKKLWTLMNIEVQGFVKYFPNITVSCCMNICKYFFFYCVVLPSCVGGVQDVWVEVVTQALAQKSGGKIPPPTS